jgi:short-subunit dehydrogenase
MNHTLMKKVIVTGAGSGIGKEFTKLFLADGSAVLAVSLLDTELEQLSTELPSYGERLQTLQMDLAEPAAAEKLLSWCTAHDWVPDTLINNAGFACFGEAVDLPLERVISMIELNVVTLTKTSMLFGAIMKERGHGAILNVGSTAGMLPAPRMAAYCATKSYVNTFTFALGAELKPYGVTVTCLTPGATQTNFSRAGGIDDFKGKSLLHDMFAKNKAGSPAEVARGGYDALTKGKRHALVGKGSAIAGVASRVLSQQRIPVLFKNV